MDVPNEDVNFIFIGFDSSTSEKRVDEEGERMGG